MVEVDQSDPCAGLVPADAGAGDPVPAVPAGTALFDAALVTLDILAPAGWRADLPTAEFWGDPPRPWEETRGLPRR